MPAWDDAEDKKLLLAIIAIGFGDGGDKWAPIAAHLPGKTSEAIRQRYQKLKREFGAVADDAAPASPPKTPGKRKAPAAEKGSTKKKRSAKGKKDESEDELMTGLGAEDEDSQVTIKMEKGIEA